MEKVRVVFYPEAEKIYQELLGSNSKSAKMLSKAITQKIDFIKNNKHYGHPIAKILIPTEYVEKYKVNHLFRVELPLFWRMLYFLSKDGSEIEIIAFVLDIVDHKKYNKKFKYK